MWGGGIYVVDATDIVNEINNSLELREALISEGKGTNKCLMLDNGNEAVIGHGVLENELEGEFIYIVYIMTILWSNLALQIHRTIFELNYNGVIPGSEEYYSNKISFDED